MSPLKIQEAKNGAVQLSEGRYFLMAQQFEIKKGRDKGKPIYVVKMSELRSETNEPDISAFVQIKSFLLNQRDFDAWLALMIQLSERKLGVEPVAGQKKL